MQVKFLINNFLKVFHLSSKDFKIKQSLFRIAKIQILNRKIMISCKKPHFQTKKSM